ncbi:ntf2 and rrm domain protein [Gigaspora margarita]|uniref:Ntf2 and rrm domain protein n=1 Tax=Gigaspora margarita TaxID=4874 RepID=A0A8H3X1W0_GIGMA|nr:ntf2 and rrm domain protein [Gigaspora margarita]
MDIAQTSSSRQLIHNYNHNNHNYCPSCITLLSQLNLKDSYIIKHQKISSIKDDLIVAQRQLINDLLKEGNYIKEAYELTSMAESTIRNEIDLVKSIRECVYSQDMYGQVSQWRFDPKYLNCHENYRNLEAKNGNIPYLPGFLDGIGTHRAYVGGLTKDIDELKLRQCVEETFGKVLWIEMIQERKCAFIEFADKTSYESAIEQREFSLNGIKLMIVKALKPK